MVKLSTVRMSTIIPRMAASVSDGFDVTVLTMSAATSSSRPSRIAPPIELRSVLKARAPSARLHVTMARPMAYPVPSTIDETPNTSNACVARSKNCSKFTAKSHASVVDLSRDSISRAGAEWLAMTMNAKRRRAHDKLAALPGVRPVRRPVAPDRDDEFDLYYVRTGRKSTNPLVIIPGGPGAASVALYRGLRRHAVAKGLDVIMIDHRGVGMSRHDDRGADLPPEALTIDQAVNDIAAVLDDAQVDKAVIYGTSYGTYLAAGVGVRHPDRVHAMVLDSPVLSAHDIDAVRDATRRVLWDGADPEAAELAPKVRKLVDDGVLTPAAGQLTAAVYGFAGPAVLTRQLDLLLRGRRGLWTVLDQASRFLFDRKAPYRHEPDLVGRIGFRELNYGAVPDGKPLDPAVAFREFATQPWNSKPSPTISPRRCRSSAGRRSSSRAAAT